MGEIRFVGTGETRGYPYLVCKKCFTCIQLSMSVRIYRALGFPSFGVKVFQFSYLSKISWGPS